MYGPTFEESNDNQKASFPICFSFKNLLKIRRLRLLKKTVGALQGKNYW